MQRLTAEGLERILERASSLRIAVVGDLMLDVYLIGAVSRISPEAPVPVVHVAEERTALGGAANVAANVAALGATCDLVGAVGADGAASSIRRALERLDGGRVRPALIELADRPTTTKTRVVARHQQVVRFDHERDDDLSAQAGAAVAEQVRAVVAGADALVLEDYNKGVLTPEVIRAALEAATEAGIPSVVDPKFRNFFAYGGATVFKPNAVELGTAMGGHVRAGDDEWLEHARQTVGARHLLLTLGEDGMAVRSEGAPAFRIPTVARAVYDVSGAGDTVTACLAVALGAGASIEEAAVFANLAAGIEVGKAGVAVVTPGELRAELAHLEG
jgi:rfaE bifunctional protein kinase chain/domain